MEKKFGKLVSNVGKNAKNILEKSKNKAVQIADQNDDGKFDLEDVTAMANSVGNIVKKGARTLKETADEKARQMERKTLLPIVLEDLNDYPMPKLIRITERDKKYSESEVCKGSIGFWSDFKEVRLMNIFRDSVNVYGISFYPNYDSEFYYVNPVDSDNYIVLDEYFDYLKQVRVGELQKIAQDLGAKHFRVTYKEEKTAFSERRASAAKPVILPPARCVILGRTLLTGYALRTTSLRRKQRISSKSFLTKRKPALVLP